MSVHIREALLHDPENGSFQVLRETPKILGDPKSTLILLRSVNPSRNERRPEERPTSSRKGRMQEMRDRPQSLDSSFTSRSFPRPPWLHVGPMPPLSDSSDVRFILKAASICPALSCNSRASRRRSSSCGCSNFPERRRTPSSARLRSLMSRIALVISVPSSGL